MKNLFFALAFMLIGTFAFANEENKNIENICFDKVEISSDFNVITTINYYEDICTITVTVTLSNGIVARGRATSHSGDCNAAQAAARAQAYAVLAEIGY